MSVDWVKDTLRLKNKRGFTLIEITVVLIIVGILTVIALPNVFFWINQSRSAEAFQVMEGMKAQLVPCLRAHVGNEGICLQSISGFNGTVSTFGGLDGQTGYVTGYFNVGNFQYDVVSAYYGPGGGGDVILSGPHWQQGWVIMATNLSGSPYKITISGNSDDTLYACYSAPPGLC